MAYRIHMTAAASDWLRHQRIYLAREVARTLQGYELTRAESAELLGMHPSDISRIMNGHYLERYSVDRLIDALMRLGCIATITIGRGREDPVGKHKLGKQHQRIIKFLQKGDLTTAMLAQRTGMKGPSVHEHCMVLKEAGTLRIAGARWSLAHHRATVDPSPFPAPPAAAVKAGRKRGFYG